jgi:hypothetical protein
MVSSMLVLKRNNIMTALKNTYSQTSLLLILLCISHGCFASTTQFKHAHTYLKNNTYYLDAVYDFELTEEAYKALRHGISFEIHTHFQLRMKRKWLWDKLITEKTLIYKLEHKPLTENYLTINLTTGLRHSYDSLDAALSHIRDISNMSLFDQALLTEDNTYVARIRAFLDIESLPPPMRPQSYFSSNWDMSSEWYRWELVR